jgi:hypothetical protein
MKGIVIKSFVDKDTKKLQVVGSAIEYNDKRFKELLSDSYLKVNETSGKTNTNNPGGGA